MPDVKDDDVGRPYEVEAMKPLKSTCFDLSLWHGGPNCQRSFVSGYGGIGVKVCCAPCGVVADVEAVGTRVSIHLSFREML